MAFYIELEKINETELIVRYRFFTDSNNIGIIEIIKSNGDVKEIEPAPHDKHGYIFERAAWALMKCWKKKHYPDKTCWAS